VTRREGQRIGSLGVAVALLVIAVPVAGFAYFAIVGDEACSRADSDFGVSSWSLIPPGHVCRYDGLEAIAETVGPSPFMSLYLVAALVFLLLLVVRRRRASRSLIHA
jgi:MYXO-CTERM domain-containing protein